MEAFQKSKIPTQERRELIHNLLIHLSHLISGFFIMKKLIPLIVLLALTACDKPYILKIAKNEVGLTTTINPNIKSYNFKAPDDETAYSRSAEHFFKDQAVDSLMDYATGKTTSFEVLDKDGQNLKTKLSLRTTDSIDELYKGLVSGSAKHMKKPFAK
jgi:hypothetical protein